MKFAKKVIVAVGTSSDMIELLLPLRHMDFLRLSEVHLVQVFRTINLNTVFSSQSLMFPIEDDLNGIRESVLALLVNISQRILPVQFEGKVVHQCIFGDNPKEVFRNYVNDSNADLVIVPTRVKRGLFESSFAHYMTKHTDADILLLKKRDFKGPIIEK
jgi:hypothetical protein